jgi:hypothetical protein
MVQVSQHLVIKAPIFFIFLQHDAISTFTDEMTRDKIIIDEITIFEIIIHEMT